MEHLRNLAEGTNLVEIYCIPKQSKDTDDTIINLKVDSTFVSDVESKFKNWKTTKYMAYRHQHLTYLYDLTDDNQIAFSKLANKCEKIAGGSKLFTSYNYSKVPTHLFPCVKDIDDVQEYTITESKINNRVSVIIRRDEFGATVYIEYKHSPNVDIDKIESTIQTLLKTI
jgi:hypothetical protein